MFILVKRKIEEELMLKMREIRVPYTLLDTLPYVLPDILPYEKKYRIINNYEMRHTRRNVKLPESEWRRDACERCEDRNALN